MKLNIKRIAMAVLAVGLLVAGTVSKEQALLIYSKGCEVVECEQPD